MAASRFGRFIEAAIRSRRCKPPSEPSMEDGSSPRSTRRDDLVITSIGTIYSGSWDKKYWSSSRGKDRYPYPVGYQAIRSHGGSTYKLEIHEGTKGPIFEVTSADADSSRGQTPEIAWKLFQKKNGPRVQSGNGKRFSSKIDGVELFGFRNPCVQRLLRQLVSNIYEVVESDVLSAPVGNEAPGLDNKIQACCSFAHNDLPVYEEKDQIPKKRSIISGTCKVNKSAKTKRSRCQYVLNDSVAANPHQGNVIFTPSESKNCKTDNNFRNKDGEDLEILSTQVLENFHNSSTRNDLTEEMSDPDNLIVKHVIYVKTNSGSEDPFATCVNNTHDVADGMLDQSPSPRLNPLSSSSETTETNSNVCVSDARAIMKFREKPCNVQQITSKCLQPASGHSSLPDTADSKEFIKDYLPETVSSSGSSDLCSEKADLNVAGEELAKSMMCFLLPRAVPLLKKTFSSSAEVMAGSEQYYNGNTCDGEFEANRLMNKPKVKILEASNDSWPISSYQRAKMEHPNDDGCMIYKPFDQSEQMEDAKDMIPDSFEDDKNTCDLHKKKPTSVAYEIDDRAFDKTIENYITSKSDIIQVKRVEPSDSDIVLLPKETDKSEYLLTDSIMDFLEALNDDFFFGGENVPDAVCSLGVCANNDMPHLNPVIVKNDVSQVLNTARGEDAQEEMDISEYKHHNNCRGGNAKCLEQSVEKQTMRSNIEEKNTNIFHEQLNQNDPLDGSSYKHAKLTKELGRPFEFAGCYMHPYQVLSICLRSKDDYLQISVICGLQESSERYLFIYKAPLMEKGEICPSFIGYTSLVLPLIPGHSYGNTTFERSGLQFTPDGQSLAFLNTVKAPLCRVGIINCMCSLCTFDHHEENVVRIGQVNLGYVLPLAKLMAVERLSCILVSEPNFLITAGVSGTLHVWLMTSNWSGASEEFSLPSFNYLTPAIELKTIPNANHLIIGHNGVGSFGLWDISKRVLLTRSSISGNLIFQILPIGLSSFNDKTVHSACQDMKLMQEPLKANDRVIEIAASPLQFGEDTAVWLLVSTTSDLEREEHQLKEINKESTRCWRLALLVKNVVVMGSMLDYRASSVDASAGYGIIGTYDGLLYKWELSTGKKLANLLRLKRGSIFCTEMDAESGILAVADDKCRLLIFKKVCMI